MPHRVGTAKSTIYNKKVLISVFGGLAALFIISIATTLYLRPTIPSVTQARVAAPTIKWTLVQEIEASTADWSPLYQAPSGRFKLMPGGGQAEMLFDGKYYLLNNIEQVDIGRGGEFRVRAVDEDVIVFVYVAE